MIINSSLQAGYLNLGISTASGMNAALRKVASTHVVRVGLAALATGSGTVRAQEDGSFLGDLTTEVGTGLTLGVNALQVGVFIVAAAVILGALVLMQQQRMTAVGVFLVAIVALIVAFIVSNLLEGGATAAGELGGG